MNLPPAPFFHPGFLNARLARQRAAQRAFDQVQDVINATGDEILAAANEIGLDVDSSAQVVGLYFECLTSAPMAQVLG